jgi:hypothetical protein
VGDICFSGSSLGVLTAVWAVVQGVIVFLFWGWINSLRDSIREAREERDRAFDGWEKTIGLGETAVRRERRRGS